MERPMPLERSPDLGAHVEILRELLEVQRERLKDARRLEVERGFIFPETTVIAKDCARLSAAVHLGGSAPKEALEIPEVPESLEAEVFDGDGPISLEALVSGSGV